MQTGRSATEYINTIISNGAVPLTTKPTGVADTFSTIIDHIITNNFKSNLYPAVIEVDITDHYPILCIIEKPRIKTNAKLEITHFRDKSAFSADAFNKDLYSNQTNSFSDQPALTADSLNDLFHLFTSVILRTIDKHAPLKSLPRRKKRLFSKPWITKGILTSIKKRRAMFKSHFLKGDPEKKSFFKKYTNKLTKIKALSKKLYFSSEINNNQNDPRKLWKVIRSALPSTNRSTVSPQSLQIDNRSTEDRQLVSNHFNEFFCTIGAI